MNSDNLVAGLSMLIFAVVGFIVYLLFIIAVLSKKKLRTTSFYMLAIAFGVADCSMLCLYIFYSVPTTLGLNMGGLEVDVFMGVLTNLTWFSTLAIIAETSLNRYFCICKNAKYDSIFSQNYTKIMIVIALAFGCSCSFPSFNQCCYFMFYVDQYSWGYNLPALGSTIISYIDLSTSCSVIILALICNIMCFLKVRELHAQISSSLPELEVKRRKREIKLFIQFFVICAYYTIVEILFNVVFRFLNGKWLGLIINLMYILQCSINGYVYVGMNTTVRKQIRLLFGKVKVFSLVTPVFVIPIHQANISGSQVG